jgi:hypothetical protein
MNLLPLVSNARPVPSANSWLDSFSAPCEEPMLESLGLSNSPLPSRERFDPVDTLTFAVSELRHVSAEGRLGEQ